MGGALDDRRREEEEEEEEEGVGKGLSSWRKEEASMMEGEGREPLGRRGERVESFESSAP